MTLQVQPFTPPSAIIWLSQVKELVLTIIVTIIIWDFSGFADKSYSMEAMNLLHFQNSPTMLPAWSHNSENRGKFQTQITQLGKPELGFKLVSDPPKHR